MYGTSRGKKNGGERALGESFPTFCSPQYITRTDQSLLPTLCNNCHYQQPFYHYGIFFSNFIFYVFFETVRHLKER